METITPASGAANPLEQLDKRRACSGFAGLLGKSIRKAQCLVPRVSGREKTTFRSPKNCFFICIWKVLPLQGRFGQLEKAPEKLSAWSQECLEGKIKKTTFRSPKNCFFICIWKVLPLQWRFGQLEKAPEKLSAWSQECLEGKIKKTTFRSPKRCFFEFAFGRFSLCNGAFGSWKKHLKRSVPGPKSVWKGKEKQLFGARKIVFSICNWKVLPLQWRFGQLEKAPEKLSAWSQECLEGKIKKTTFRSPKSCFFEFACGRFSLCNGALGSWKKHLKRSVPGPKSVWKGKEKFNWQLEGSPFAMALWAAGKST